MNNRIKALSIVPCLWGWLNAGQLAAQNVDLAVHGFMSDVTIPIGDLEHRSLEYMTMHPSQTHHLDFAARIVNNGPDTATNVTVSCQADLDGIDLGTYSSVVLAQLSPGETDTLVIPADLDADTYWGQLSLRFNVTSGVADTVPENDLDTVNVKIRDWIFSRWDDEWSDTIEVALYGGMVFVRYEITEQMYSCGVGCVIPFDSTVAEVDAYLYDENFDQIAATYAMYVAPSNMSDTGQTDWIWEMFTDGPYSLEPGHDYYVALEFWGLHVLAAGGACPDSTAFLYNPESDTLITLSKTPLVSLYGECPWSVQELVEKGVSMTPCVPNPANGSTTLTYSLKASGDVNIDIQDVQGSVMKRISMGKRSRGRHSIELDVSSLRSGVYACSITFDGVKATQRMVVIH